MHAFYVLFIYCLAQKQKQTNSALFTCTLVVCEEPEGFLFYAHAWDPSQVFTSFVLFLIPFPGNMLDLI